MDNEMVMNKAHHPQRILWFLILAVVVPCNARVRETEFNQAVKLQSGFSTPVRGFDNKGQAFIPTLLEIAATYNLPMGIEKVTKEALEKPLQVRLPQGTVAKLLDLCIHRVSGYSWAMQDGVILIYGKEELHQQSNLLNFIVENFAIHNKTLSDADNSLRTKLFLEKKNPNGYVGSYTGSTLFENKHLNMNVRRGTIRQILNKLVALHGNVVWVARVPPELLSQIPSAGLWVLLPKSVKTVRGLLDPSLQ